MGEKMIEEVRSEFSVLGCMHKLGLAGEKVGLTRADWNDLAQDERALRRLYGERRGLVKSVVTEVIVDCDASPRHIDGFEPIPEEEQIKSRFRGKFRLTEESVAAYLVEGQRGDGVVSGTDLCKTLETESRPVLPDQVLDAMLDYPELIPEEFKGRYLYFFGTKRRGSVGSLYVRYLYWDGGRWCWDCRRLEFGWYSRFPAAVPASI